MHNMQNNVYVNYDYLKLAIYEFNHYRFSPFFSNEILNILYWKYNWKYKNNK